MNGGVHALRYLIPTVGEERNAGSRSLQGTRCDAARVCRRETLGLAVPNLERRAVTSNSLRDSLHSILDRLVRERAGFNIFRRFRLTHLEKSDCPEALKHFWSGHAPAHVSERYVKLIGDREYRLTWAEKIGLEFELPEGSTVGQNARNGRLGLLIPFRKVG